MAAHHLHVEEYTASSPSHTILLVHGGASSSRMYRTLAPLLTARGYNLLVPDLPGHGLSRSEAGTSPELRPRFTFSAAVSALVDLVHEWKQKAKEREKDEVHSNAPRGLTIVGTSLGGQVVLALLSQYPELADTAIVSGVSISPPDSTASWEMPRLPLDDAAWMAILHEDVSRMGMENAQALQDESLAFSFSVAPSQAQALPPILVLVGEKDVAMARRDFAELSRRAKRGNSKSKGMELSGGWHNHSIDVPELFASVIDEWIIENVGARNVE